MHRSSHIILVNVKRGTRETCQARSNTVKHHEPSRDWDHLSTRHNMVGTGLSFPRPDRGTALMRSQSHKPTNMTDKSIVAQIITLGGDSLISPHHPSACSQSSRWGSRPPFQPRIPGTYSGYPGASPCPGSQVPLLHPKLPGGRVVLVTRTTKPFLRISEGVTHVAPGEPFNVQCSGRLYIIIKWILSSDIIIEWIFQY